MVVALKTHNFVVYTDLHSESRFLNTIKYGFWKTSRLWMGIAVANIVVGIEIIELK